MTVVTEERTDEIRISEAPWNGSAGNYTDDEFQSACALDRKGCGGEWADKPPKSRCSLPYKTPSGEVSRAGVHAAAARLNQVSDACPASISKAKSKLRAAYKALQEDPPDSLKSVTEDLETLAREFGVVPGQPRHGEIGMRMHDLATHFRDEGTDDGYIGTLYGHFAVFNRWTEIRSLFEGHFLERLAPGCFKKTIEENRDGMRCLFQHGRDPSVGMKPLGPIRELKEDDTGSQYEVPLIDASYNRDLLPGLKDGLYGASFRFQVIQEEVNTDPGRSEYNPNGIEERTIVECRVREFGPVTFPQYEEATAGARSLNDWWLDLDLEIFSRAHPDAYPHRLAEILTMLRDGGDNSREEVEEEHSTREAGTTETEGATTPSEPDDSAARREKESLHEYVDRTTRLPGSVPALKTFQEETSWNL